MATRDHLDLLIKLLKLTASPHDAEALAAARKANAILTLAEWQWESLLRGKVTIIGDPFGSVVAPQAQGAGFVPPTGRSPSPSPFAPPQPPRAKAPRPARAKRTTLADLGLA
jgi:hypothetical protein